MPLYVAYLVTGGVFLTLAVKTITVVPPAATDNNANGVLLYGALVGLATYATLNITSSTKLNARPNILSFVDFAWGAFATGAAAWLAVVELTAMRGWR